MSWLAKLLEKIKDFSTKRTAVVDRKSPIALRCSVHGKFYRAPIDILRTKHVCPKCSGVLRMTDSEFIRKARSVHGNLYDYSKVSKTLTGKKVSIICKEHGEFKQSKSNHVFLKNGCPHCAGNARLTVEKFISKATKVHGGKYDYSLVKSVDSEKPIQIICKIHGSFKQNRSNHLIGHGCKQCAIDQNHHTCYKRKEYKLGSRIIQVQGFEPFALDYVLQVKKVKPNKIYVGIQVPIIEYRKANQQQATHYPDFFIPEQNRLVEVKSVWTFLKGFSDLKCKREASVEAGFRYTVLLMSSNGERLPLPKRWYKYTLKRMNRYIEWLRSNYSYC